MENKSEISGTLTICCNDFSNTIVYDTKNDRGKYGVEAFKYTNKELIILKGSDLKAKAAFDKSKGGNMTTQQKMLVLAHDFPFVVYSIDYGLSINFKSRLFNMDKMQCWFSFFPLSRKFYHRSEAILDDLIFEILEKRRMKNCFVSHLLF
ncbi:hypothetical protein F52700_2333 [Fusarium sp. NRRL 52700]|nr:hypothetical protein F52700_2333 [Fusarium sp. NRRL 52700]